MKCNLIDISDGKCVNKILMILHMGYHSQACPLCHSHTVDGVPKLQMSKLTNVQINVNEQNESFYLIKRVSKSIQWFKSYD